MSTAEAPLAAVQSTSTLERFSCLLCSQRKVKCDKRKPCANCSKARIECVFRAPALPRRRKRLAEEDLQAKLERYEELLKGLGVNIDGINEETVSNEAAEHGQVSPKISRSNGAPEKAIPVRTSKGTLGATPSQYGRLIIKDGKSRYLENLWTTLGDDEHLLENSECNLAPDISDDGGADPPARGVPDLLNSTGPDIIFGDQTPKSTQHPQPAHILQLWQIYLENVDPLIKIFHPPTVEPLIYEAINDLDRVPKVTQALMFAIYVCAVNSMTDEDCIDRFGENKAALLSKFIPAGKLALIKAGFLRCSDFTVLQAQFLLLLVMRQYCDPRSLFAFSGMAVRCGQLLGLHRDGSALGLSVFETEMRRRLWWQILMLDGRAAEVAGARVSMMSSHFWDTRPPSNLNDSDLSPNMQHLPAERIGPTDMMQCLVRCTLGQFLTDSKSTNPLESGWQKVSGPESSIAEKDRAIDELERTLEDKFLRYCDPTVPLHFITSIMARSAIAMMRLVAHHPRRYPDKGAHLPQHERDLLFTNSLKVIEYKNLAHSTKSTQRFLWWFSVYFPWHAFIYLLGDLRFRTFGKQVDKAWQEVDDSIRNHPEMIAEATKPLHVAMQNLITRAWQARVADVSRQQHRSLQPPLHVSRMMDLGSANAVEPQSTPNVPTNLIQNDNLFVQAPTDNLDPVFVMDGELDPNPIDWAGWDALLQDFDLQGLDSNVRLF